MFVIVIGGGKVGRYLVNEFLYKDYRVVLIERDREKADKIKERFGIEVILGDGSEKKTLEKAGIEECDAVLAVTEDDQDNLVICQLAERQFHIPRTFTRVNTPGNEKLFKWLGVNVAVSSAAILSALVDREVTISDLDKLLNKDQDKLTLVRIAVPPDSPVANKRIREIDLPIESVLVTILRGEEPHVPRGNTRILTGDIVLALTRPELKEELLGIFDEQYEDEQKIQ